MWQWSWGALGGAGFGGRCGSGLGLACDLLVQVMGEAGADGDEVVQGRTVEPGVRGLLAGIVWVGGLGCVRWSLFFGQAVKLGLPDEKDEPDDGQAEAVWC